jgi:hypothetical protein
MKRQAMKRKLRMFDRGVRIRNPLEGIITPARLREWGACYSDEEIASLFGKRTSATLEQVLRATEVPATDRIWVATRPGALPTDVLTEWVERIVTVAVATYALTCPATEAWALGWLSGEDRTEEAAWAARAAWAAARAAWAAGSAAWAARAAWDAAWAAWAAWAAAWAAGTAAGAAGTAARTAELEAQIADLLDLLEA